MTEEHQDYTEAWGEGPDNADLPDFDELVEETTSDIEPVDFSQHLILSYIVENPSIWIKANPILKPEYFDREFRPVVKFISQYYQKYKRTPNAMMVRSKTGVKLDKPTDAEDEKIITSVCDEIEEFCRSRAFLYLLADAAETTEKDKSRETTASYVKQFGEVVRISMHRDLGFEVHESTGMLAKAQKDDGVSTGFTLFDRAFGGGVTRPSFNIVSAASGDGKSIFMQNIAVNYARMGENVVFYSLELEPPIVQKRFSAMMTNTDISIVYSHLDTIEHSLRTSARKEGAIYIKKFPMVGTTVADIEAHYFELMTTTTLHFGVVCVDYMDLMYPLQKVDMGKIHLKDKYVSEELNDFMHEHHIIGWSASQQTKGAEDEKEARRSGVAGGTPKVNTCDNLIIGKRSDEDREDERWWAHVKKARSSGAVGTKIPLRWDDKTQRMSDGPYELFEEANPYLFGKKRARATENKSAAMKDPLLKAMGVKVPEATRASSQEESQKKQADRILKQLSRGDRA